MPPDIETCRRRTNQCFRRTDCSAESPLPGPARTELVPVCSQRVVLQAPEPELIRWVPPERFVEQPRLRPPPEYGGNDSSRVAHNTDVIHSIRGLRIRAGSQIRNERRRYKTRDGRGAGDGGDGVLLPGQPLSLIHI